LRHAGRLAVAIMAVGASMACAGDLEFAGKTIGRSMQSLERAAQYRANIVDPVRAGKPGAADANNMRIIPMGVHGEKPDCSICGVVETISLTTPETNQLLEEDAAIDNALRAHDGKGLFSTEETLRDAEHETQSQRPAVHKLPRYEVKVRMANGTVRIVNQQQQPGFSVGDLVRVTTGAVTAS
jgi:hypothetical protein